jgi:hypothetical protein
VEAFCDPGCRLSTYTNRCTRRVGLSPANELRADIKDAMRRTKAA